MNLEKISVEEVNSADAVLSKSKAFEFVGKIASLSYGKNYEYNKAVKLAEKLIKVNHMSPFEFVRVPISKIDSLSSVTDSDFDIANSFRNNFLAYIKFWNSADIDTINTIYNLHLKYVKCFKVKCPIYVARQFMRHRSFSYMEKSLRRVKEFSFYLPEVDNKLKNYYLTIFSNCKYIYNALLREGVSKELARAILPLSTMTEFYVIGHLSAWKNFFEQRLSKEAQRDIYNLALAIKQYFD